MNERTGWREVKGEEVIDDLKEITRNIYLIGPWWCKYIMILI